jgi:uncharacterized protein DUF6893
MKNGKGMLHKTQSSAAWILWGAAAVAAGIVLVRSLPDLVRYFRVRRM